MSVFARAADLYGPSAGPTLEQTDLNANVSSGQAISSTTTGNGLKEVHVFGDVSINPLVGGLVLIGVIIAVKLLREWHAAEGEVRDVKAGLYSWIIVTLMAAAGLPILKAILAKFRIPGVSDYVQNA